MADDRSPSPDGGPRATQAVVAALCVLGLLVAAAAAPTLGGAAAGGSGGGGGSVGGGGDGGGGGSVGGPGLIDLLRWLLPEDGGGEPRDGPDCAIAIEPRPTPGREVTVTVTRAGVPVDGALVRFDGDPVGRTDAAGRVRGRVPYVRRLSVSATFPDDTRCVAATATEQRVAAGVALAGSQARDEVNVSEDGRNVSRTVTVDGRVRLVVTGTPDPGSTVVVHASVEELPMRNATVSVDGRTVGRTDEEGRHAIAVPADGTERLRVRVVRGDFAGETTVPVRVLDARVEPVDLLSLPGEPVVVHATLAEQPAVNAVVTREGRRLGTTDGRGRLAIALPADPRATVTVRDEDQTTTAVVWPLYAGTALVVGLPAVAILVAGAFVYRAGGTPSRVGGLLSRSLRRALAALVGVTLWVADALERTLGRVVATARRLAGRVREDWPAALRAAGVWLVAAPVRAWRRLRHATRSWARGRGRTVADPTAAPTGAGAVGPAPFDLREAWRRVARAVAPSAWRTRTPGEVVRAAVEQGLPREPVERLATVFEEVEYGDRPLSADRRERAREAFDALLVHWRERDQESEEAASDGGGR